MSLFTPVSPFSLLPSAQQGRTPRTMVMINGTTVLWTDIVIVTTTFYIADTFQLEIPLNGQPTGFDLNYWASSSQFSVKIYLGFPQDPAAYSNQDLDLFMTGEVDEVEIDPLMGRIMLYGRDLSSRLIDQKVTQTFSNNTSSQIVTMFANQNGLTPQVTNTTTPVGNFFQTQQTLLANQYTQWDLLTYLAQQENFVLFVDNETLIFEPRPVANTNQASSAALPPPADTTSTSNRPGMYVLTYQSPTPSNASPSFNGTNFLLSRSMTLSTDVSVTIKVPCNPKTGRAFSARSESTHRQRSYLKNVSAPSGKKQKYVYILPGLTPQQAQQKADQLLNDITIHEVRLNVTLPGDNTLKKDSLIQIKGTNTSLDQVYYPDQIVRHFDINGYFMDLSAKNKSVDTEEAA